MLARWPASLLRSTLAAAALAACAFAPAAIAGPVLNRIKSRGAVHCGAAARPGLLALNEDGAPRGLLVELCRAFGVAAAGAPVEVAMTFYDAEPSYDAVRAGRDDLFFLSGSEIVDHKLADRILPGPLAFIESSALMTRAGSPFQRNADLAGEPICFLQGDVSHRHLEAFFAARRLSFVRMGYQEEDEMVDAFDAGACIALAGEATALAQRRLQGGANRRDARILAEPLASFPILAATGVGDGEWSALVSWTLATLINADRPRQDWAAGGTDSLPLDAAGPGFAAGWQQAVLSATGGYAAILRRNVGAGSPLGLPPGPNALTSQGGLLAPPYAE